MADLYKASMSTSKKVDKTVYNLSGQFTYNYTESDSGGSYTVPNPEPGVQFLPDSMFSIDGGTTWFSDLEDAIESGSYILPEINTCVSTSSIIYRWASYSSPGSFTVLFRTKLLAVDL